MTLKYSVRPNTTTLTDTGKYTFNTALKPSRFNYKKDDSEIGDYEMKYGYQDQSNPNRIKWRVVLNAVQDKLNNMVIKDDFSDSGQVLVEGSLRAVRYATQPEKIKMKLHFLNWNRLITLLKKQSSLEMLMVKSQDLPSTLEITGTGRCTLSIQLN